MPSIVEVLSAIDTAKLSAHLETANGTVKVDASASLAALNPRDLLGDFGKLLDAGTLAKADPKALAQELSGRLGDLGNLAQIPAPALIATVADEFGQLIQLLEQVAKVVSGEGSLLDRILESTGGFEQLISEVLGRVADSLPLQLPVSAASLFQSLAELAKGGVSDARQAADLLARFLTGLDLHALSAPSEALGEFAARVRAAGGDFGAIHLDMQRLAVQVRNASAMLLQPELDVSASHEAITQVRATLDLLLNHTLAGAMAKLSQDFAALDPGAFANRFRDLLAVFPATVPGVKFDIEQDLVKPVRGLSAIIDQLTPETLNTLFAGLKQRFADAASSAGIPDLLESIDGLFDIIIEQLRRVPLHQLRDELINALIALEAKIRTLPGLETPRMFRDQIQQVIDAIDKLDTASVQQRVTEFAGKIDAIANKFPVQDIKNEVQGLIGGVKNALDQVQPALDQLNTQLDGLGKQIEGIDFNASGQATIDLIHGIRQNVESAVGSADLPEPAKLAIGAAAGALKSLDVKVEISQPFNQALDQIDPKIVLAPLEPALAKVRGVLETVSPKAIIDRLDQPFQELMGELEKLKPAALLAGLAADFSQLVDLVGKLDPRSLVAPLEEQFQKLIQQVRSALDPAPLFAPLHEAYAKLQQLLDLVDLEKVVASLSESLSGLPTKVVDSVRSISAQKVPGSAPAEVGEQRPLRFGDIIRPLIAIIKQVRNLIARAAEQILGQALDLLQTPISVLARLADDGSQLLTEIASELDQRLAEIDIFAMTGPAVELRAALMEFQLISASLSGDAQVSLGPLTASINLDVQVGVLGGPWDGLQAQRRTITEAVALPDLVAQLNQFDNSLSHMIPSPLRDGSLAGAAAKRFTALFDFLDFEALAKELDELGDKIQAKLLTLAAELAQHIIDLWTALVDLIVPLLPVGLIKRIQDGMKRIRDEFAVLDPAPIEAEVKHLLDVALGVLNNFSPAKLVSDLGGVVDAIKDKLNALDPAQLLGQIDPVANVIDGLQGLKPSVVLAPLLDDAKEITLALENLTKVPIGDALIQATAKLKAALELVVQGIEKELEDLLDFLEGLSAGGGLSVSASVG